MSSVILGPRNPSAKTIEQATAAKAKSAIQAKESQSVSKQAQDAFYKATLATHRFQSFAPPRNGNTAKWYVDGHDFLWAISEIMDAAKQQIYILDWWLSPEVYLRRPPELFPGWRLEDVLLRKAEQGVKVHIIVYKEVPDTSSIDSAHSKHRLEKLHPNIGVMRHPDHTLTEDSVFYWSHHEKLVVVDNTYVSMGGIDLCFGRWDNHNHPLADAHPTEFDRTLFPGQDFNNARTLDFQSVNHFVFNQLSLLDSARMPWHDISMIMMGPSAVDAAQHFVERWNYVKKQKYEKDDRYPYLPTPHEILGIPVPPVMSTFKLSSPFSSLSRSKGKRASKMHHPLWKDWEDRGKDYLYQLQGVFGGHSRSGSKEKEETVIPPTCKIQVCRSVSEWSHGVPTETSIQNAYIQMIKEAEHFIYIENQFFISNTVTGGPVVNQIAAALVDRILQAAQNGEKFKVIVTIPEVPAFSGTIKDTSALQMIMAAQWRTINRGGSSIMEKIRAAGFDPTDYITWYHLRTYDRINGAQSLIQRLESKAAVPFDQAQVALDRIWLGEADPKWFQNGMNIQKDSTRTGSHQKDATPEKLEFPQTIDDARNILKKFESAATPDDKAIKDNVGQHALADSTPLQDEKWPGTEQEEKDCYITEELYIHSKVMIVDDRRVIMGSANFNDRSMKGDGDSEITVVIEDADMIDSQMNGQPYQVSRFAASLRRALFKEHLGLIKPTPNDAKNVTTYMTPVPNPPEDTTTSQEDALVADPLSDQFEALWKGTAKQNTEILLGIYKTVPNNLVLTWKEYDAYIPKMKVGHVASDASIADIKDQLSRVRGHLVEGAIDFLSQESGLVTGLEWTDWDPLLPLYV